MDWVSRDASTLAKISHTSQWHLFCQKAPIYNNNRPRLRILDDSLLEEKVHIKGFGHVCYRELRRVPDKEKHDRLNSSDPTEALNSLYTL
jgi:hypothetical protein